jgi:crotonobetainyl-CoA:carnitine CoA-transferase CaiB-like acyl-CoA transferase
MAQELPLADVKILDFMWVMAGPASTRILADYGATIVRIESVHRIDTARTLQPFHNGQFGPDSSGLFSNINAGKLGLALDLSKPQAREVVFDLVRWADIVTESFSPKAMRAWGLDYESLRKVKPDIIMLSTCLMGQTGPLSKLAGFGNMAAAISGFFNLCGWPDRPPAGPFGAYTDYVAPRFTAIALMAALEHRRQTGHGQYIDQSQAEAALHLLGPALLDYTVNRRVQRADGNKHREMAPHGVYPAAGDDRWVAIACRNDEQWQELCAVIGKPQLAKDNRFASAQSRLKETEELDRIVGEWTCTRDPHEIESQLQSHGIAASAVQNTYDLQNDPQLKHRDHFVELEHPTYSKTIIEGTRAKLSRTPGKPQRCAPSIGRDNQHVLEEILGYSEDRITELVVGGVLE